MSLEEVQRVVSHLDSNWKVKFMGGVSEDA